MKNIYFTISLVLLVFMLSCRKENMKDCIKSTGDVITETRLFSPIDTILVQNNINLYLRYDSVESIIVEAGKNLMPFIETSIENKKLILSNKNKCNFMRNYETPIHVTVSIPDIKYIQLTGSANINSMNKLTLTKSIIVNSGIGDINLDLEGGHILTQIYGSGGINLTGKAAVLEIYSTGNCFMHCENLMTGYAFIYSNTTGNIYVHAEKELGATIVGSGDVFYSGNPELKNIKISGKGRLRKL